MMFKDRISAAKLLLKKLEKYRNQNVLVAGIPRGAMPMAKVIADDFGVPLTAVLAHKISAPDASELAVGSIGLSGHIHRLPHSLVYGANTAYFQAQAAEELKRLRQRQSRYQLGNPDFKDRTVIIVDDGIATGATATCAIHEVRSQKPQRIILATPVASPEVADRLRPLVDEFVALYLPQNMYAIGQFYENFEQVSDNEVVRILHNGTLSERTA